MADFFREPARIMGRIAGRNATWAANGFPIAFFPFPMASEPHNGTTDL
jgi:hypothetical protein